MKRLTAKLLAVLCAVAVMCTMFGVSASAISGGGSAGTGKIVAWGCDMSYYNTQGGTDYSLVDFAKMKADGCSYVILRIGYEGSASRQNVLDTTFVKMYQKARSAGMHIGLYFYSLTTTYSGAVEDANWVADTIESYDMYFEYPLYYDVEDSNQTSLGSSAMTNLCLGWCETLEGRGYFPGIYGGETQVMNKLSADFNSRYDTWIARVMVNGTGTQYNPASPTSATSHFSYTYGMWQYKWYNDSWTPSYDGSYWKDSNGYPLDCNVAYKNYPNIMQTYGYNNVVTKHKITFESNGGSAVSAASVTDGQKLTKPTDPTKYAFTFAGWYCDPALTAPYDFNTAVPYDFTLYAKWEEAYWGAQTNLMPNSTQLQLNSYNGQGAIWPYWNTDTGAVTFYNGVTNDDNWSWPSAYMSYENSFDSVGDTYLYIKKDGNALFNVVLTYLDKDGNAHDLHLSDVANITDSTDFPAGYLEEFYNVGSYIRNIGHAPASGNVKFTKVTYFIIGEKDSFVTLYDLKFTSRFEIPEAYTTLYDKNVEQIGGKGAYTYQNGVLNLEADTDAGYSVKFTPNAVITPAEVGNLLMDVNATAPFNVTLEVTATNGDATMELRNEFFDVFNLTNAPDALPAGAWKVNMNLYGYYQWNGGIPTQSTVKSVTITLAGKGTVTLNALQASRSGAITYVNDGQTSSGNNRGGNIPSQITSDVYRVEGDIVSAIAGKTTVSVFLSGVNEAANVVVRDANGNALDSDAVIGTGAVIVIQDGGNTVREYTAVVTGDINGDGLVNSFDARAIIKSTTGFFTLTALQQAAADFDGNNKVSTSDVREILAGLIG